MKYNGKELKEYKSDEPVFFDPPKRMLCWDDDTNSPVKCLAFSYDGRMSMPVVAAQEASTRQIPEAWPHCAEIPEEYYALVVVEHRAVSGINRYGLGKFVTREDAKFVMDSMVELLGGDPKTGSKDIYIVPFNAVRGFPYGAYDNRMDMDRIPDYLVDAYDGAMKKFLGEEDTGRPRIKDLPANAGEVYAPREETPLELSNKDKAAMVNKLRQKTERGMFPCKRALEECGWDYDKAYALIRELPVARAPKEPTSDEKLTDMEARTLKNKMVAELVYKTGWGAYHCMKALQACGWKPDAAERMLKEKFKDFATKK